MDKDLAKLLIALIESRASSHDSCTMQQTAVRFNESASNLAISKLEQHQKTMHDADTLRMKLMSSLLSE